MPQAVVDPDGPAGGGRGHEPDPSVAGVGTPLDETERLELVDMGTGHGPPLPEVLPDLPLPAARASWPYPVGLDFIHYLVEREQPERQRHGLGDELDGDIGEAGRDEDVDKVRLARAQVVGQVRVDGVDAGQGLDEGRLAVIDMSSGSQDDLLHRPIPLSESFSISILSK